MSTNLCTTDCQNPAMADECLALATEASLSTTWEYYDLKTRLIFLVLTVVSKTTVLLKLQCWNGLQKSWSSRDEHDSPTPEQSKQIAECERYMFRVYCYRAETVNIIYRYSSCDPVYQIIILMKNNKSRKTKRSSGFFAFFSFQENTVDVWWPLIETKTKTFQLFPNQS